jgi:hypothetical protein
MRLDTLYQVFRGAKAATELAYLLGYLGGKKLKQKK